MTYTVVVYKQPPVLSSTLTVEGTDTEDAFRKASAAIDGGNLEWTPVDDGQETWCGQAVPVNHMEEMRLHPERYELRPVGELTAEYERLTGEKR